MEQCIDIVLASGSPRRKDLFNTAGLSFDIFVSGADEHTDEKDPEKYAGILSKRKAIASAEAYKTSQNDKKILVTGADTVVAYNGRILGKPLDEEDAFNMLMLLSGNVHQVYTGVSAVLKNEDGSISEDEGIFFTECTEVEMYPFDRREAYDYISSKEPMDKAGSYGIQGIGGRLIKGIKGDYDNVVGFSLPRFMRELKARCYIRF